MKKLFILASLFIVLGAANAQASYYSFAGEFVAQYHMPGTDNHYFDYLADDNAGFSGFIDFDNNALTFITDGYSFTTADVSLWYEAGPMVKLTAQSPYLGSFIIITLEDTNADGIYDVLEFGDISGNGVAGAFETTGPTAATPLPAAIWLFGSAILGLLGFRRKFST